MPPSDIGAIIGHANARDNRCPVPGHAQTTEGHIRMALWKIPVMGVMAVETNGDTGPPASRRLIPRTRPAERIAAVVLVVAALAIAGQFAWQEHHSRAPVPGPTPASAVASATIRAVRAPTSQAIVRPSVHISPLARGP